jgi:RHS repeat-associated protein
MVEQNRGGSYTQIVYSPTGGKLALMRGQSLQKAFVLLPGGGTAVYNSTGLAHYRHPDWLGSSRLATTPSQTVYAYTGYAPFGENYEGQGSTDLSFTGQNQDTVSGLDDFLYREYSPAQGRWISPDPSGLQAVDTTNPQSWNRYAYLMNNPLAHIDQGGLGCVDPVAIAPISASGPDECASYGGVWQDDPIDAPAQAAADQADPCSPTDDPTADPPADTGMPDEPGTEPDPRGGDGEPAALSISDPSHPPQPGTMTCPGELQAGAMRALGCLYEFACPSGQVYEGMQKCSITDPYGYKLCPATSTIQISPGQPVKVGPPPPGFCGPVKPN